MSRLPLLFLVLATTAAVAAPAEVPRLIDADGPVEGVRPLLLTELWRVGTEDDDVILGEVIDVAGGPDGRIYVLDHQLCHVLVLSAAGEMLGELGREGDGPGEVRQPTGLAVLADGEVGIGSGFPGRVMRLDAAGDPLGTCHLIGEPAEGNIGVLISLHAADGVLAATGARLVLDPTGRNENYADRFLAVGDIDCAAPARILHKRTPLDPSGQRYVERDDYYIDTRWALGAGGHLYVAWERDAYAVSVFDRTGALLRVFGREEAPRRRTAADKARVRPTINLSGSFAETMAEENDPRVERVLYDHDADRVWVLSARGAHEQPAGVLQTWDVFSADGAYLRRVPLPVGDGILDGDVYLAGGDRLIVVRGVDRGPPADGAEPDRDEPGEPLEVICYRMRW